MRISFFGLGNMGSGMAKNLLNAGHEVCVYDLVESNMLALKQEGAMFVQTPLAAAKHAECVISMLPAGKHVIGLYKDIIGHVAENTLFIDCSTIEANDAKELHKLISGSGHRFIDSPVSGGVAGASAGTLTFIIGGQKEDLESAEPILKCMGKHCFHAGGPGAGQIAKICNNMLLAVLMAGTSEALNLAIDNGLDPLVVSEIMKQSSGNNWALQVYNPVPGVMENVPSSKDYEGGFLVDLMNKDLNLATSTAQANQSTIPMGSLAKSLYQMHAINGFGGKDFSSIYQAFINKKH